MLEKGLKFLEELPEAMVRPVGNIVYSELAIKLKAKEHPLKNGLKVLVVLGILYFLYRRFIRK